MKKSDKAIKNKVERLRQEADILEKSLVPTRTPQQKQIIQSLKERVKGCGKPLKLEWHPQTILNLPKIDICAEWVEEDKIRLDYYDVEYDIDDLIQNYHVQLEKEFNRWVANCPQLRQKNKEIKEVCSQVVKAAEELEIDEYDLMDEVGMV